MLFPKAVDVTRVWKQIVQAVINDRLGPTAKVATDNGNDERLICVYTRVSHRVLMICPCLQTSLGLQRR